MGQNESDHDILIEVRTTLGHLVQTQNQYLDHYGKLLEKVTALEIGRNENRTRIDALEEDVTNLSRKSAIADAINTAAAAVAGIVGFFFGQR